MLTEFPVKAKLMCKQSAVKVIAGQRRLYHLSCKGRRERDNYPDLMMTRDISHFIILDGDEERKK